MSLYFVSVCGRKGILLDKGVNKYAEHKHRLFFVREPRDNKAESSNSSEYEGQHGALLRNTGITVLAVSSTFRHWNTWYLC